MYYKAVRLPNQMWTIQGERGGVVPEALDGKYTKKQFAEDKIKAYEASKESTNGNVQKSSSKRSSGPSRATSKKAPTGDGQ